MSSKNTLIIAVVIIALFLGGFFLASTIPLYEGEPEILENFQLGGIISAGYFVPISIRLKEGTVDFSYDSSHNVNAFIMTPEQYYGYAESLSGYIGSLDAGLDSKSGTLSCEITKKDTYYFIIENEQSYTISINSYSVSQTVKQTLLESLRSN